MINLFEYKNKEPFSDSKFQDLENFLDEIWSKREVSTYFIDEEDKKIEVQRFIQFFHKDKKLKSNKYVGVIHFQEETINLLPKIFFDSEREDQVNVCAINKHILWWLSYCRKLKFPNYLSSLNTEKADFFEILIYLFTKYTRELLHSSIYQAYIEVKKELTFVKGRIDFNTYINSNLSTGRYHKVVCDFDAFEIDNEFNRAIKFVSKLLLSVTKENQSKRFLNDILFILDEVSDVQVSAEYLKRLSFNPMFASFEAIRDYCVLFLENSISFNYKNDLKLFAFLLPMEYVFEDFITGFIDKEMDEVTLKDQDRSKYLTADNKFQLRPDLLLNINNKKVIADAKYKIVYEDDSDSKKSISQADLYQVVSYAIRYKVQDIFLFYPNTINIKEGNSSEFYIIDELANEQKIKVTTIQLPIINHKMFAMEYRRGSNIEEEFVDTKNQLIEKINRLNSFL